MHSEAGPESVGEGVTWAVTPPAKDAHWRVAMSPQSGQVVCFEAFRQARERRTARVLPYLAPMQPRSFVANTVVESPFRAAELTDREVEHRQRMLRHLTGGSA